MSPFDLSIIIDKPNWREARDEIKAILLSNPKITFDLTLKVLQCFLENPLVTEECISFTLWRPKDVPEFPHDNIKQHISVLRKTFRKYDIHFRNLGYKSGWTIEKGNGHYD